MRPIITLLTDFGTRDTYVAQMKGVILGLNPDAQVVDLTHEVGPQQVRQGAFLLETAIGAFPWGTIHLAVVDPGVGTDRPAIAVRTPESWFVGPDNGLLSAALPEGCRPSRGPAAPVTLPAGIVAVELSNRDLQRPRPSRTFHGRDIFAPAAASISLGVPPERFGPPIDHMLALPPFRARRRSDGTLEATVASIDRFGNVTTDCRASDIPRGRITVQAGGEAVPGPARTYAEASGLVALVGSAGYLEIALPGGSAASALRMSIGDEVRIVPANG